MTSGKVIWTWQFLALLGFHYYAAAAPEKALITSVPGYDGSFPSKHYGGYVTVDEAHGRYLYYYFVTSQGNPAKDPVVLWLNGGPGCSSFDGFVYEHGPFNFEAATNGSGNLPKLHLNPYAWSKVSSIIYLDSPSGVGFSYSRTANDYNTGDFKTAKDTHTFLLEWFEEYPEFQSNPFFIAGESFAGIYVPTLASEVSKGIVAGLTPALNFKGYMVGNGVTDHKFDGNALVPFVHGMGLISDDIFQEAKELCKDNYWNYSDVNCNAKLETIDELVSKINVYDILEPCYHDTAIQEVIVRKENLPESYKQLGETGKPHPVRRRIFGRAWPLRAPVLEGIVPTWPQLSERVPCFDDRVATLWLNDESVRAAIRAEKKNISGDWQLCSDRINYYHDAGSMINYHENLTSQGYRALIYSGDHDMCVPYTGSEAWTRSLGYAITDSWRPWLVDGQVAGYTQGYANNLTFATVKGSGHTVPEYKPAEALALYSKFLAGDAL
ncbi:serine carboxypeptidase 1 [Cryptomeria japonica]|uniref:serine carboxypeptidase 1 n=1 Tax=Cryptomeria japonica TaxID=3369 RepID=UPI0025ABB991|nr:serine carboxypeptidase 1 [Cryptomeria japonica]XP_057840569.1 serine carboxypeptidase 1 [Cryptomeria japonica]XP_057840570.1 serine carboxypeptidase 1 [Cryptomeria japonica]XP_057840571.1 serine carboxypeptidase 1 [Cryptomeria japonica]XP_057840572.1 serine carboxypeptidase 1 [Cryptomeria japonica]